MKKIRSRTLTQQILRWIVMIIVVLGLSINTAFYLIYTDHIYGEVNAQLSDKLNLQALYINRWVEERAADIHQFAGRQDVRVLNKEHMLTDLTSFIKTQTEFENVGFINLNGFIEVDAMNLKTTTNYTDMDYFREATKGNDYISKVVFRQITGEPLIIFASPAYNADDQIMGLIFGTVKLETIHRTIQSVHFGSSGEQYLIDKAGVLITEAHTNKRNLYGRGKIDTDILKRALSNSNDRSIYMNYRAEKVIGAYQWTKDRRWIIVAEIKSEEAFASLYDIMFVFIMITVAMLIASFYGIVMVMRRIERPLEFLQQGTKVIKEGHFGYLIDPSVFKKAPIELKELCDTYNLMSLEIKRTIRLLEDYALIDALTELYNRRYLMDEGGKVLDACIRAKQPCIIMMIDVDYFKKINDTYGHQVGDRVLHHIGKILKLHVRPIDIAARYGGEEFMVLVQQIDLEQGRQWGEAIRQEIENTPYTDESVHIPLTASIGIALLAVNPELSLSVDMQLSHLVEAADRALYKAKQNGRNRTEIDTGMEPT